MGEEFESLRKTGVDGLVTQMCTVLIANYLLMHQDPLSNERDVASCSWPSKGKSSDIVFIPHFVDDV